MLLESGTRAADEIVACGLGGGGTEVKAEAGAGVEAAVDAEMEAVAWTCLL